MSTSLTLTNLNMEDSGIYRCIANNSAGSTNMSFTLQVTTGSDDKQNNNLIQMNYVHVINNNHTV
jgi:hypothetical protein